MRAPSLGSVREERTTVSLMDELFQAVREAASPADWSRGVELVRAGAVYLRSDDLMGEEIELLVAAKGGMASRVVVLYPDDEDWSSDASGPGDADPYVAAAVIAVRQSQRNKTPLPRLGDEGAAQGHVGYRLHGRTGQLYLRRVVVVGEDETEFVGPIRSLIRGKTRGPKPVATPEDLAAELVVGTLRAGPIPRPRMAEVLGALSKVEDLTLDRNPVAVGAAMCGLQLRVEEVGDNFLARLEQDPGVKEVFENGAFRRDRSVHAVGPHGLNEREFTRLRKGQMFDAKSVGTLVGELLPKARRTLPVVVETDRLPGSRQVLPRIELKTTRDGDDLELLATIVYGEPPVARVDGDRLVVLSADEVPLRNTKLEARLVQRLSREFGLEPGKRKSLGATEAIGLSNRLRAGADGVRTVGRAHEEFFATAPLDVHFELGEEGEDFELWFEGERESGGSGKRFKVEAGAVIRAWQRGEEVAPLLGGGFGRIPFTFLQSHGHLVADLLEAKQAAAAEGKLSPAILPSLAKLAVELDETPPPALAALAHKLTSFEGIQPAKLPDDLRADLRPYQTDGVNWLAFLRSLGMGALLADDMGLGKTLQALCVVDGRTLVVAPTSVLQNWRKEAESFRPGLSVSVYHGPKRSLDTDAELVLTTYAILRLDRKLLGKQDWKMVVLDEAQTIKNPESQVAQAAYTLPAEFRVALSGTPVENRLEDLWSQFHFLNRGLLGGRRSFQDRYVKAIAVGDAGTAARLRERIRPFVLRREKREVATELPPRTDVVLHCELTTEERRTYDAIRAAAQSEVVERLGAGANPLAMLEALLRLRQAACHPSLLPGAQGDPTKASSKVELLLETLKTAAGGGHKSLVFSQWTSLLDLIEPHLRQHDLSFVRLDGSTRDRQGVVDRFQADDGPDVMLISLKAGGTGLNLTAADHVFLCDPWWNPAVEDQAADRAHRIGQERPVFVHRLVAEKTVEERILELQNRKRLLAEAAVGEAGAAAAITREELLALLE